MREAGERPIVLSMLPVSSSERRVAILVGAACLIVTAVAAPFARAQLAPVHAFIPCYEAVMVVNDLITAALLFGQFRIACSRALLMIGCGYLFTSLMSAAHALTFPGLFSETGLLGAGRQSTAWLYMFWHAGFPLAVIGYAMTIGGKRDVARGDSSEILASVAIVIGLVVGLTALSTAGEASLPEIMQGNRYTSIMIFVVACVWMLSFAALAALWRRRKHSTLDLWLMVVVVAWLCDVALSAMLNGGRYDLGFYAGRTLGLIASSFVLAVLLLEARALYVRLALSLDAENRERQRRLDEMQATLAHISRLSEVGQMASILVHEVNQPLTAIANYADAGRRLNDKAPLTNALPIFEKVADQTRRAIHIVQRFREFGKKSELIERDEDLRRVVEEISQFALIGDEAANVELATNIDADAASASIDKIQIQQVLLNLIRNAIEAMIESPTRRIAIGAKVVGDRIEVRVADSGPGLPPEVRAKLFQPFITTKETGMGVGLSICRGIIESHGGTIAAENHPEGGAIFRFTVGRGRREFEPEIMQ